MAFIPGKSWRTSHDHWEDGPDEKIEKLGEKNDKNIKISFKNKISWYDGKRLDENSKFRFY